MIALFFLGAICMIVGTMTTLDNILGSGDRKPWQVFIGWLLLMGGAIMFMCFLSLSGEETGYKIGQKDALKGTQNLVIQNTFQDTTLVKSDTIWAEGFEY